MRKFLATAALAALLCGCGSKADVSGKVKYKGLPVVFGSVVLVGSDGLPKAGTIQPDGSYRISGVPLGPAKVAVSSPAPPGATPPPQMTKGGRDEEDRGRPAETAAVNPEVVKNWFPLPEKYGDPAKSGRTVEVKRGVTVDIDLP